MGEAILTRTSGLIEGGIGSYDTIIRCTTFVGAVVECTNGNKRYTATSSGVVDFPVKYGTWTVTSTYKDIVKSATVDVSSLQTYEINLKGFTYGLQIDCSISNPYDACRYIGDSTGFTPLECNHASGICNYGSWADIVDSFCKPCLWNNGAVVSYLDKNNYGRTVGGATADITSGNAGDVMVEFSKKWYKYSMSGNVLTFEVSDYDRSAEGFVTAAFVSEDGNAKAVDAFYYGAYNGFVQSNVLRSLSGKTPTVNTSYNDFISIAKNRHAKCTIETFFKRFYILGLLMLVTKSRDGQATIGAGRVQNNSSALATGTMNTSGLFYGKSDTTVGSKAFGIEHLWGNLYTWMAGLVTRDSSGTLGVKQCAPFDPNGSGYTNVTTGVGTGGNWPTKYSPFFNGAVILPTMWQSNQTIGWPDYFYVNSAARQVAFVGGYWNNGLDHSGPFYCRVDYSPSHALSGLDCGARLLAS